MNYSKPQHPNDSEVSHCYTFCKNVCALFSSGRQQCINDCLSCSRRASSFSQPLVSKKVHRPARKPRRRSI